MGPRSKCAFLLTLLTPDTSCMSFWSDTAQLDLAAFGTCLSAFVPQYVLWDTRGVCQSPSGRSTALSCSVAHTVYAVPLE